MSLKHDSLQSLFSAIADSIRAKGNVSYGIVADDFPEKIMELVEGGGVSLPILNNPGIGNDLAKNKELIDSNGNIVLGTLKEILDNFSIHDNVQVVEDEGYLKLYALILEDMILRNGCYSELNVNMNEFGNALPEDVAEGKTFTSTSGLLVEGTAKLLPGTPPSTETTYPNNSFIPTQSFEDGKQYALVGNIDGQLKYLDASAFNEYTVNAININIQEETKDYIIFSSVPTLFTAVASDGGFLLKNNGNYLYGESFSGGTSLKIDATLNNIWTINTSTNPGFSEGTYYPKLNELAVWLTSINSSDGYTYSIKYETAGSFGFDRDGRSSEYSTGFIPFVVYEYVGGGTTALEWATPEDVLANKTWYDEQGNIQTGTLKVSNYYYGSDEPSADLGNNGDIYFVMG